MNLKQFCESHAAEGKKAREIFELAKPLYPTTTLNSVSMLVSAWRTRVGESKGTKTGRPKKY